jgi:plastocyanin
MELSAADTSFAPNRWRMALGDTVVIRLTNADTQQHNLRLAGLDGEFDTDDDALTSPDPVGAGEAGELTFVPQASGNYTFRCDYHPASMGGSIEVE